MQLHNSLRWLAEQPRGEIQLIVEYDRSRQGTAAAKMRAMRESIRLYRGWHPAVREMVERGELRFETKADGVWAVRQPQPRSIREVLAPRPNYFPDSN